MARKKKTIKKQNKDYLKMIKSILTRKKQYGNMNNGRRKTICWKDSSNTI